MQAHDSHVIESNYLPAYFLSQQSNKKSNKKKPDCWAWEILNSVTHACSAFLLKSNIGWQMFIHLLTSPSVTFTFCWTYVIERQPWNPVCEKDQKTNWLFFLSLTCHSLLSTSPSILCTLQLTQLNSDTQTTLDTWKKIPILLIYLI